MQEKKIHLACGNNIFIGWENYDFDPINGAKYINLLDTLPFETNSIDYIYFEHGLEHFDEMDGFKILEEIYRVLKIKSVARIVTPSLDTYINRYLNWNSDINIDHRNIFYSPEQFLNYAFFGENTTENIKFLNGKLSSNIGHKYIYSKNDLIKKVKSLNFDECNIKEYKKSNYMALNGLETRKDNLDLIIEMIK